MLRSDEYFADPARNALMRRAYCLHGLLRNDPRFSFYGRAVVLNGLGVDGADTMEWLARLQGVAVCYYCPKVEVPALFCELEARGLVTDRHELMRGGAEAVAACRIVCAERALPGDLSVALVDGATPRDTLQAMATLWQANGVMTIPGPALRGDLQAGVCAFVTDRSGAVVAAASSFAFHHPQSERSGDVFWGMLVTREDRRGEGISLWLGAHVLLTMHERHGATGFVTGVRADNAASNRLCNRLGVRDTPWILAQAIDHDVMGVSILTK